MAAQSWRHHSGPVYFVHVCVSMCIEAHGGNLCVAVDNLGCLSSGTVHIVFLRPGLSLSWDPPNRIGWLGSLVSASLVLGLQLLVIISSCFVFVLGSELSFTCKVNAVPIELTRHP